MADCHMLMCTANPLQVQCFPKLNGHGNYFFVEDFSEYVLGDASLFTNCATSEKLFNLSESSFLIFRKAMKYLIGLV